MSVASPQFPPVFKDLAVVDGQEPMAAAIAAAAGAESGAGDLFWSTDTNRAAAAFVLEPEVPLSTAIQMAPVLMVAIGDALGAIGPPALAITFRWPFAVLANGGVVGCVSVAVPGGMAPSLVPDKLIVGFNLALESPTGEGDPGLHPDSTALHEEGCGELDRTVLIEAVARHFLAWIDTWLQDGFPPVHQSWLSRAQDLESPVNLALPGGKQAGTMMGLDEHGSLLLKAHRSTHAVPLVDAMEPCP
ncbi:biotin/lipoate--protein ligase family protein [Nitratireductor luteus]|uniref:biotin/lipoate--protein ligase family protein n=1 Tax=Nitratireductor luteus TaxID=2976980 RepID=UPI0022406936